MLAKKPLELVLASASQRRADLLGQIGVVPDRIVPANIDESPITGELPRQLVSRLSASKAILVSKKYPRSIILAADTVVACGRRVLSKPENLDQARSFLSLLSGRRHRVISGLAIISPNGNLYKRLVETHVNFFILNSFPIPRPNRSNYLWQRVVQIAGRLAAPDERFSPWAQEIGVDYGPIENDLKLDYIYELDAIVSHLYGLTDKQLIHIFETFHKGWDYQFRLNEVMKHYYTYSKGKTNEEA